MFNQITKETRREAYVKRPAPRARKILEILGEKEMTGRQITYALGFVEPNAVLPRLTEMRDMGMVKAVGKTKDMVTGKTVALWKAVEL